ncbi:MAG: DUF885 family protein [Bacilli bacterium]|nr:DUF885 family protein [Bacilli bacterium]
MNKIKKFVVVIILFISMIFVSSCSFVEKIDPGDFEDYSKRLFNTLIGDDELTIHFLFKDKKALGVEETTLSLPTPGSSSALGKLIINLYFGPMANYKYEELNFDQKMTYCVILDLLDQINSKTYEMSYLDNNYLGSYLGYQAQLPILFQQYRFDNYDDVLNYFNLMRLVPDTFKQYYEYEVTKAEAGYGMPDFVIDKVVSQCDTFIQNPDEHFLITTFEDRLKVLDLTEEQISSLKYENASIVKNDLCRGYEYIKDNLPSLKGKATNNLGLAHYVKELEDGTKEEVGKDYYAYLFKDATGYDDNIEDAIDYIQTHLDEVFENFNNLKEEITNDQNKIYQLNNVQLMDKNPSEQMEYYKTLLSGHFPKIESYPTIHIKDVDPSMENNFSPAAYVSSPIDDYENETIFLNQAKINGNMNYLYTTLGHEGIPGHMYQNIYFKTQEVNLIRKVLKSSGYQEGWATYVELYMYNFVEGVDSTVLEYLKYGDILSGVLTARLDMGIHYEGWDLEQTHNFILRYLANYDLEKTRKTFEQLVEVPTNSQTYYYTYFKLCDMYNRCEEALQEDFNVEEFHKLILDCGPVPLRFVEVVVDEYIESKTK